MRNILISAIMVAALLPSLAFAARIDIQKRNVEVKSFCAVGTGVSLGGGRFVAPLSVVRNDDTPTVDGNPGHVIARGTEARQGDTIAVDEDWVVIESEYRKREPAIKVAALVPGGTYNYYAGSKKRTITLTEQDKGFGFAIGPKEKSGAGIWNDRKELVGIVNGSWVVNCSEAQCAIEPYGYLTRSLGQWVGEAALPIDIGNTPQASPSVEVVLQPADNGGGGGSEF